MPWLELHRRDDLGHHQVHVRLEVVLELGQGRMVSKPVTRLTGASSESSARSMSLRRDLGAEAADARRLVHDDRPAGLLHARDHGLAVERARACAGRPPPRRSGSRPPAARPPPGRCARGRPSRSASGPCPRARPWPVPNGMAYCSSGTSILMARYTRFGSKKTTGSGSRMAEVSRPLASYGSRGITTLRPGMCA